MKIYDVPLQDLETIARETGVTFEGSDESNSAGYRVRGRLIPDRSQPKESRPYQKTSASYFHTGRKVFAVCWHGHRDFMRAVFAQFPDARITTGLHGAVDYRGRDNFESTYRETGLVKIGAPIAGGYPRMVDACECSEGDSDIALGSPNPVAIIHTERHNGCAECGEDKDLFHDDRDGRAKCLDCFDGSPIA